MSFPIPCHVISHAMLYFDVQMNFDVEQKIQTQIHTGSHFYTIYLVN